MQDLEPLTVAKLCAMTVLYLFLPLTALTYYAFRRNRKLSEVQRVFSVLRIEPGYQGTFREEHVGPYLAWAVLYSSVVVLLGLSLVFFGAELGLAELPAGEIEGARFPAAGSRTVAAMAFLGAYVWALQYLFRRYSVNDLSPVVYYGICVRAVLAMVVALVIYNAFQTLPGSGDSGGAHIWPALALLIGMFPRRGLRWLSGRLPLLAPGSDPSVREAPLEMIEGVSLDDALRLEEVGIDSCYDLATADFVPLILKTPYGARELVDWILQAKLCIYFGPSVRALREHGIRTIVDLARCTEKDVVALASEAAVTRSSLERAWHSVQQDAEIPRLRQAAELLGRYWHEVDEDR